MNQGGYFDSRMLPISIYLHNCAITVAPCEFEPGAKCATDSKIDREFKNSHAALPTDVRRAICAAVADEESRIPEFSERREYLPHRLLLVEGRNQNENIVLLNAHGSSLVQIVSVLSSSTVGKRLTALVLAVFVGLSVGAMSMWRLLDMHTITGDEPHYLVIADGLLPTFELEQSGPYSREFRNRTIVENGLAPVGSEPNPGNTHAELGPRGLFNVHNIGLPVMLAFPYLLFGEIGARLAMIAIGSLILLVMSRVIALTSLTPRQQLAALLPFAIGIPLVTGSTQIYPDLPAGLLCLLGLLAVLKPPVADRRWDAIPTAAAVALLPWLHIRFGLPMLVVLAALSVSRRNRGLWNILLRYWLPAGVSVLLLAVYNVYAFGNPTGPYASGDLMLNRIALMQFLGLLFDQNQGIFIQQPLHLVGLYYSFRVARQKPLMVIATALVSLSVLIPNATHWNLYGGWSFSGRFGWTATTALSCVTLLGTAQLFGRNPRLAKLVIGIAVAVQIRHLYAIFVQKRVMFPHIFDGWIGTYSTFWSPFESVLPHWRDHRWAFGFAPNLLILGFAVTVALVGGRLGSSSRERKNSLVVASTTVLVLLAAFAQFGELPYPQQRWAASVLPGTVGKIDNLSRVAAEGTNRGMLTFGPFWEVPPGTYEVGVRFYSETDDRVAGILDVYMPETDTVLARRDLPDTDNRSTEDYFTVNVTRGVWGKMEIRTSYEGSGRLQVDWLQLRRISDNVAE